MGAAAVALGYSFAKVREAVTALVPAQAMATVGKGLGHMAGRLRRVLTGDGERTIYKMGMVAAIIFAAQMFNFPINQGTSGHLLGGVLAGVVLGPFAGTIVIAAVLASLACALELGLSGTLPFYLVILAMVKVHMVIGLAEALITLAGVNLLRQMLREEK